MRVSEFDFELPDRCIALAPARPRDSARLLHVAAKGLADRGVSDLPLLLRRGDHLVLNDTKVIPARLRGVRPARGTGGGGDVGIDFTLHKRLPELNGVRWRAFARPARRLRPGDRLVFGTGFSALVETRNDSEAVLRFNLAGADFDDALKRHGAAPLPPYIARRREADESDSRDYQTVYAREAGSVAAPTAGLHFTDELFAALETAGVGRTTLTLHVGAGTFLPVAAEDTAQHVMHAEWGEIDAAEAEAINAAKREGGRVVAVGTTALRLLETAADESGTIQPFSGETDIFITPGYRFRAADLLMTNFHLPRSTLFMLVCAFAGGERMKRAYEHAIAADYRFYSYGDACLLERAE
jgi:S-adenosylmethionine:tRNA ribosyltransferase-isomerase